MLAAVWAGPDQIETQIARRTGRVYVTEVEVPATGWP
jgi:hypothetical protein